MVLAFLLPGAGHFYLGKRARGVTFFCIVVVMFALGLSIDGDLYTLSRSGGALLRILASLGSMGSGVLYFVGAAMGAHGDVTSITYEHGTAFTITAGLMNLLLVLDSFDISEGRKE
jgi:predicted tellurium resistance membrane protein TerC